MRLRKQFTTLLSSDEQEMFKDNLDTCVFGDIEEYINDCQEEGRSWYSLVSSAFMWIDSPEGNAFWAQVANRKLDKNIEFYLDHLSDRITKLLEKKTDLSSSKAGSEEWLEYTRISHTLNELQEIRLFVLSNCK